MMDILRPLIASIVAILAWDTVLSVSMKNYIRTVVEIGFNWFVNQLPFEISSFWQLAIPLFLLSFFPRVSMVIVVPYIAHLWYGWFQAF